MRYSTFFERLAARRAQAISQELNRFIKPGDTVLDLGAGNGHVANQVKARLGADITLLDIIDKNKTDLPLILYEGKIVPFRDDSYDVVLLIYVLCDSLDPISLLKEAIRVSNSKIIIFEDVYTNFLSYLSAVMIGYLANFLLRIPNPLHLKKESDWLEVFGRPGVEVISQKTVRRNKLDPVQHIFFVLSKS